MNYLDITHCDMVNGDGNRVVLWVAGCSHHCPGCQNPASWDPLAGVEFDAAAKEEMFRDLSEEWCAGATFSGGDPLYEGNRSSVIALAKEIRERFPDKTVWVYTGYGIDEVKSDPTMSGILEYADVLCDGEFVESKRDPGLHWVGSTNQHVLDLSKMRTDS